MADVKRAPEPTETPSHHEKTYRVKDVWKTLQGEGFFAGRPAVFVRFVGCNMWSGYEEDRARDAARHGADCPHWCDTDFRKEGSEELDAWALATKMQEVGGEVRFCVLTGGEPFLQADAVLVGALRGAGFQVAVETNGTVALEEAFWDEEAGEIRPPDWIVCSPKLPEEELRLERCHELKLVVPDYRPADYEVMAERVVPQDLGGRRMRLLWVQPEDGPRFEEAKRVATRTALARPAWRVSIQTHKVLGVK